MTLYPDLIAEGDAAAEQRVRVERREDRATIYMSEPERLNALSAGVTRGVRHALEQLALDDSIKSVVLSGDDPAFSAGGDLKMMELAESTIAGETGTTDIWRWIRREFGGVARLIARMDKAVISALNGPAAGVGLAWALTSDLVIASEKALLVPAFGKLGLLPEVGTSWALTRSLGLQGAFAFFVSGEHLDAEAAREAGLVHEVVAHEELTARVGAWCDRVAALPPHALAMTKPLLRAAADASWDASLAMEEFAEPNCFTTDAFQGNVKRMLEKR